MARLRPLSQVSKRVQRNLDAVRQLEPGCALRQRRPDRLIAQKFLSRSDDARCGEIRTDCDAGSDAACDAFRLILGNRCCNTGSSASNGLQQRRAAVGDDEPRLGHQLPELRLR
jgi:hypothetical protein